MTRGGEAGFTLVEVLIALALLGMLTILAYSAIQFGNLSWRHASGRRAVDADQTAVRQLLEGSIASAYPAFASSDLNDNRIAFDGAPDRLGFIAPLPEALAPGIMAVEQFALGHGSDRDLFEMSWHLNLPASAGGILATQTVTILRSIRMVRFAYFGRLRPDRPAAWFDTWRGMDRLPEIVRVRIWRSGLPDIPWLDFSVAPKITTSTACFFDLVDSLCWRHQ